ncbi:peptidoglycan hydrolase [Trinickia mobilis]|uniref:peptidoglycan hydrolase n=1 Tax=Trinickia mobilis TaxID=2816356 RepID=UPI001A8F00E5|nr:peptidoglycan hydrolase [Trinickia mobilis]
MTMLKPLESRAAFPLAQAAPAGQDAPAPQPADDKRLRHASEQFEAMFIKQMLREMNNATRAMSAPDSPLRDTAANDMLDYASTFVADALASQHAFGISDFIVRQLAPGQLETKA